MTVSTLKRKKQTYVSPSRPDPGTYIRRAVPDDAEVITQIYVDSWNEGFRSRMPAIHADDVRIARWRADLGETTPTLWWIAERNGTPSGFTGIRPCRDPIDPDLGELDTIAVLPSAWHTGIGKALMAVALEALHSDGYQRAILWTLSRYPLAESFYVSTGWQRSGKTRDRGNQVRYEYDRKNRKSKNEYLRRPRYQTDH